MTLAPPLFVGPDTALRRVDNNVQPIMGLDANGAPVVGPVPVSLTAPTVTPHFAAPAAESTTVIPIGAIGAGILILTGTGTINGVAWPAGTPWNDPNKLAATVTLILDTPGTAVIYYGT